MFLIWLADRYAEGGLRPVELLILSELDVFLCLFALYILGSFFPCGLFHTLC